MQVICNTEDFQITEKTAVTLGKFDGIHKGHQRLLNALLEKKKQGLKTVVFTFFVPPIPGREDVRQLTPNDEKKIWKNWCRSATISSSIPLHSMRNIKKCAGKVQR